MKTLSAALLALPLLIAAVTHANAGSYTRVVTTSGQCRDFTRTTNYVNRSVSETGTACLFPDGAWHDVTSAGEPIIQYENPVIVEQPVVYYSQPQIVTVPVYYNRSRVIYHPTRVLYDRFNGPGHYYNRSYRGHDNYNRGGNNNGWSIHGRF